MRQRLEIEPAAVSRIKKRVNVSPAKFIAELYVVASDFPGKVVDKMPVNIRSRSGHGKIGPDRSDRADGIISDANERQAEILLAGYVGIESDRARVEIAVFGKKSLFEIVVAETRFIELVRRKYFQVRDGDQVHIGRGHGVITRQNVTTPNGKRERL